MRTILIIDDDAHTNEIVCSLTEHGGYRVLQAVTIAAELPPLCAVLAVFRKEYGLAPRRHELLLAQMYRPKATWSEIEAEKTLSWGSVKTYFQGINLSGRTGMCALFQQHFPLAAPQSPPVREVGSEDRWIGLG